MIFRFALCLAVLPRLLFAQFTPEELMRPGVYTNEAGEVFAYRLHAPQFPEPGRLYPLILFLHGSGECGTNNLSQIKVGLPTLLASLIQQSEPFLLLAPQSQTGNWWVRRLARDETYAADAEPMPSLKTALDLCRHLIRTGLADPDRIYITGLSLGGFGAWDAIQREPDFFAAAVPICGGGDIRRAQAIKRLPIWVFHGAADQSVPVDSSRRMVEALRLAGSRVVRYTEYEQAGHNVWDKAFGNPELRDWLLRQTRARRKPWWRFW